jgi:hypothetical protein
MGRFLQGWALASAVMLLGVVATGLFSTDRGLHVVAGYLGTVFALFAHTIAMFYFIGTGSAVKNAAKERVSRGDGSLVPLWEQTKVFKNALFPAQMLAMLLLMATSILGAGVVTRAIPTLAHGVLNLLAVPVNLWILIRTVGFIEKNIVLMNTANDILVRLEAAEGQPSSD